MNEISGTRSYDSEDAGLDEALAKPKILGTRNFTTGTVAHESS
jgi:hypothetical protein